MKISQTVFELQSGHDFVTEGGQGKNSMSPNPTGGDMKTFIYGFMSSKYSVFEVLCLFKF